MISRKTQPTPVNVSDAKDGGMRAGRPSMSYQEPKTPHAHKPTLKGVGKSDCSVRIVGIAECEHEVAPGAFGDTSSAWTEEAMMDIYAGGRTLTPPYVEPISVMGSRAAQARKAYRRPFLARKQTTPSPSSRLSRQPLRFNSPKKYVSGATIRRLTSGMWAVRKQAFSGGKQDGSRLLKQIQKQLIFSATCRRDNMNAVISTPEIYGLRVPQPDDEDSSIIVDMEYIPFHDCAYIMLEQDKAVNEWLIGAAISIVDYELISSTSVPLKQIMPEFHGKADSIKNAMHKSQLLDPEETSKLAGCIDTIVSHYDGLPDLQVPIGTCHGDLTLQNMLVDPVNRELCVFDFLDCFVESPLQDIAKLLQDCRHLWFFTQVEVPEGKHARAVATLGFFYERLRMDYESYAFWEVIPLFEFMCLARILPYMTTEREKKCIVEGLESILEDITYSSGGAFLDVDMAFNSDDSDVESCDPPADETVTVIVPALGPDSRQIFPDGQIKLLTTNPNGRPLIVDSISGLGMDKVSTIIVAVDQGLIEEHCGDTASFERLFEVLGSEKKSLLQFYYASTPTADVIETVTTVLTHYNIQGAIFIKDADNSFVHSVDAGNYAAYLSIVKDEDLPKPHQPADVTSPYSSQHPSHLGTSSNNSSIDNPNLRRPDLIDATKKSYLAFSYDNIVSNISHASFISSQFCCGGYAFLRASAFLFAANQLRSSLTRAGLIPSPSVSNPVPSTSLKIIDVIYSLLTSTHSHLFFGSPVADYNDWGSPAAWSAYKATYTTSWVPLERLVALIKRPDAARKIREVLELPRRSVIFWTSKGEAYTARVRRDVERILSPSTASLSTSSRGSHGGEEDNSGATGDGLAARLQMVHSLVGGSGPMVGLAGASGSLPAILGDNENNNNGDDMDGPGSVLRELGL